MNKRNIEGLIIDTLKNSQNAFNLQEDFKLSEISKGKVYKLKNGSNDYHVKWCADNDPYDLNEIRVNRNILNKISAPAPKSIFISKKLGGYIICWKWIDGADLKKRNRKYLYKAFEKLGQFHLQQKNKKFIHSFHMNKYFPSVREMISAELSFYSSFLKGGREIKKICKPVLSILDEGYPTLVHGDFHPGNIIKKNKKFFFVDWAFAYNGLNFTDLEFVSIIDLKGVSKDTWWIIRPNEAEPILKAYFKASGLNNLDIKKIQYAVMLRNELDIQSFLVERDDKENIKTSYKNIELLLDCKKIYF